MQHSAGVQPGLQPFGQEWFGRTAGVRLTMLGVPGTEVHTGDGPMTDGPPYARLDGNPEGSCPLVLARRMKRGKEDPRRLGERRGEPAFERPQGPLIWAHGASVGEMLAVMPLMESLRARGFKVLVTSGTVTSA